MVVKPWMDSFVGGWVLVLWGAQWGVRGVLLLVLTSVQSVEAQKIAVSTNIPTLLANWLSWFHSKVRASHCYRAQGLQGAIAPPPQKFT